MNWKPSVKCLFFFLKRRAEEGKGCSASGPRSWMLSDELAQGSPAGVSASFPDGVREGGGGGIFREEASDGKTDECE